MRFIVAVLGLSVLLMGCSTGSVPNTAPSPNIQATVDKLVEATVKAIAVTPPVAATLTSATPTVVTPTVAVAPTVALSPTIVVTSAIVPTSRPAPIMQSSPTAEFSLSDQLALAPVFGTMLASPTGVALLANTNIDYSGMPLSFLLDDYAGYARGAESALPGLWRGDKKKEGLDFLLASGILTKAQDGAIYNPGTPELIEDSLMVGVARFRLDTDRSTFVRGTYYLVIDFVIMNFSRGGYFSTSDRFTLSDERLYTYSPTRLANTIGDIEGVLAPQALRRGEVAFEVPQRQSVFLFDFNPGASSPKPTVFRIDATSLLRAGLPLPQR